MRSDATVMLATLPVGIDVDHHVGEVRQFGGGARVGTLRATSWPSATDQPL